MKAKWNRYDLSLWDLRKLSLYGRAQDSVQVAALNEDLAAAVKTRLEQQLRFQGTIAAHWPLFTGH